MFEVGLVAADVDLGVLGVRHDLQQVLREDVERVDVVQGEHQDGSLGELEVAGGDRSDALQAAGIPELELKWRTTNESKYTYSMLTAADETPDSGDRSVIFR